MKIYVVHLNKMHYIFNIKYIFIYLINPILNICNFIFLFIQSYIFFDKNEIILVYKLN